MFLSEEPAITFSSPSTVIVVVLVSANLIFSSTFFISKVVFLNLFSSANTSSLFLIWISGVFATIILCDVQNDVYPELEKTFLNVLHGSGFPDLAFNKKVDFEELYKKNQETKN